MDIHSYYIIVQEAREKLKSYGMTCPEIGLHNIIMDKDTNEPCYSLDLSKLDENRYHHSLRELDTIIDEILGRKDTQMPRTFKVNFDENFSKDIPRCWYEKSKKENAFKDFDINGNLIKDNKAEALFTTYTEYADFPKYEVIITPVANKKEPIKSGISPEIDDILNSYSTEEKIPDTYS